MKKIYTFLITLGLFITEHMHGMIPQPLTIDEIKQQIDSGEVEVEYTNGDNQITIEDMFKISDTLDKEHSSEEEGESGKSKQTMRDLSVSVEKDTQEKTIDTTLNWSLTKMQFDEYDNWKNEPRKKLCRFSKIDLEVRKSITQTHLNTVLFSIPNKITSITFNEVDFSNFNINGTMKLISTLKSLKVLKFKNCTNLKLVDSQFKLQNIKTLEIYGNEVDLSFFNYIGDCLPNVINLTIKRKEKNNTPLLARFNVKSLPKYLKYIHITSANFKYMTKDRWNKVLPTLHYAKFPKCKKINPAIATILAQRYKEQLLY